MSLPIEPSGFRINRQDAPDEENAKDRFLSVLSQTGNSSASCRASGLTRRQINIMRQRDLVFAEAYDEAMDDAADLLEAEAWRRALEGVAQPLIKAGQPVLDATGDIVTVRRYSDPLLVMLLRGCKPGKFQRVSSSGAPSVDTTTALREIAADDDPPHVEQAPC